MRPSWQVDLKWLCGFGLLASVVVSSALYSLSQLTEHEPATRLFGRAAAHALKEDADEEARVRFAEMQERVAGDPNAYLTVQGVTLPVTGASLAGLTYDEAVDLVAGQTAEILYREGPDAALQYFEDNDDAGVPETATDEGTRDYGPLALLTQSSHDKINRLFQLSLAPLALLAIGVAFFSRRFGRVGSLGVIGLVGIAPFAAGWNLVEQVTVNPGEGMRAELALAIAPTVGELSDLFRRILLVAVSVVALTVASQVASLLWPRLRDRVGSGYTSTSTELGAETPARTDAIEHSERAA